MKLFQKLVLQKQRLYNHFKSKEEICLAYLQFKNIKFLQDVEDFTTSKPKGKLKYLAIFDFLQLCFSEIKILMAVGV